MSSGKSSQVLMTQDSKYFQNHTHMFIVFLFPVCFSHWLFGIGSYSVAQAGPKCKALPFPLPPKYRYEAPYPHLASDLFPFVCVHEYMCVCVCSWIHVFGGQRTVVFHLFPLLPLNKPRTFQLGWLGWPTSIRDPPVWSIPGLGGIPVFAVTSLFHVCWGSKSMSSFLNSRTLHSKPSPQPPPTIL